MNQQEIKENMTKGTWVVTYDEHIQADSDIGYFIADCGFKNSKNDLAFKHNPHAITHAINNTYGKNINPESVSEMYDALVLMNDILHSENIGIISGIIKETIKKATL